MAEQTGPDRNDPERAPEEAAIDTWLDDSSVYLTMPQLYTMGRYDPATRRGRARRSHPRPRRPDRDGRHARRVRR